MSINRAHTALTTSVHDSATVIVRVGRWFVPIACVLVLSMTLAFVAEQAFLAYKPILMSAEAAVSSDRSFSGELSAVYGEDSQQCPQSVAQADIDIYLLVVSANLQQLRAN